MRYTFSQKDANAHIGEKTATPSELVEIVKDKFNRYNGGEVNSIAATMDYHKKGYIYKKNILIYGTIEEFKEFEELIKPIVEYFTPRTFH